MNILGNISKEQFLKEYWQKKPLLIRQAYPNFEPLIPADELAGMSLEEEIESRIKDRRPELSLNRSTIAGKLKRMADDGWLTIIVEGAGRRPTTYQRKTGPLVLTAC